MEWTNIEKKWHEMARRLQNASPTATNAKTRPLSDDSRNTPASVPPVDLADIGKPDARAMA